MGSSWRRLAVLVRREYTDTVKTKAFWFSVLAAPAIFIVAIIFVGFLSTSSEPKKYAVVDDSAWVADAIRMSVYEDDIQSILRDLENQRASIPDMPADLRERMIEIIGGLEDGDDSFASSIAEHLVDPSRTSSTMTPGTDRTARQFAQWWVENQVSITEQNEGLLTSLYREVPLTTTDRDNPGQLVENQSLDAYFYIPSTVVASNEGLNFVTNIARTGNSDLRRFYERHLNPVIKQKRIEEVGISEEEYQWLRTSIQFNEQQTTEQGESRALTTRDRISPYVPMVFVYVMWFIVFIGASTLISSTVEEKNSKVAEVLLCTLSTTQLMYGKVLAGGASILTMVATWVLLVLGGLVLVPFAVEVPIGLSEVGELVKLSYVVKFVVYTIIGYFMLAPLMSALGAAVSSVKAAQTMVAPISMVMVVPIMVMFVVTNETESVLAQTITFIPFYTPFALMMRAASPPAFYIELFAISLSIVTLVLINIMSARIFEKSILQEGPTPTYRQLAHMIKS